MFLNDRFCINWIIRELISIRVIFYSVEFNEKCVNDKYEYKCMYILNKIKYFITRWFMTVWLKMHRSNQSSKYTFDIYVNIYMNNNVHQCIVILFVMSLTFNTVIWLESWRRINQIDCHLLGLGCLWFFIYFFWISYCIYS